MFFATASHNSLFLPVISKNHAELPSEFVSLNEEKVVLDKNITVLGFPGSNIDEVKANLFNLNQKIYNKYGGFKDFQMVMILPDGNQDKIKNTNGATIDQRKLFFSPSKCINAHMM
jgi:hypothetical protein